MYDQADVGLVDAHAEGVRRDDDTAFARLPAVLAQVLGRVVQPGVVVVGGDACGGEQFGHFLGVAPAAGVDDGSAGDAAQDVQQFLAIVLGSADDVGQVGPLEAHAEDVGTGKAQSCLYVVHYLGRGGGRQGEDGNAGQQVAHFGNLQVGGAEVVAPLRDAMAFVHGYQVDVHPAQLGAEDVGVQPFGRDVEELVTAEDGVFQRGDYLLPVHAGVDGQGADAPVAQVLHLVFHQGDEGRDDEAHALARQGRHLEGDGLAAARGHQAQRVFAAPDAADDVFLDAPEGVVVPVLFQQAVVDVFIPCCVAHLLSSWA